MSEKPHYQQEEQLQETFQEFRERLALKEMNAASVMALYVDYLMSKKKNRKILIQVQEAHRERYGA